MTSPHTKYVVGLMSGTSLDGMDAALTEITRDENGLDHVELLAFSCTPYPEQVREELLLLAGGEYGGSRRLGLMSSLLGQLYTEAVTNLLRTNNFPPHKLDLIASHGQTLYHSLTEETYLGYKAQTSLQLGEPSYLAEAFGCEIISDFRVRDIAAGGLGAPLVPFVEYSLYRDPAKDQVFLNIGGISNITWLPASNASSATSSASGILGFDTGPGNMLIDQAASYFTNGQLTYDRDGRMALAGQTNATLLAELLEDPYYKLPPPKNSGRENFGAATFHKILTRATELGLAPNDLVATLTTLTARVNAHAIETYCPAKPARLIVSGGGSRNPALMAALAKAAPSTEVVTGDTLGYNNDAKEAVAFAYLGYKCALGEANTLPDVTGARHSVTMGKRSR